MKFIVKSVITLSLLSLSFVGFAQNQIAIAIHGGAGTISKAKMTPEKRANYEAALKKAIDTGYQLLSQGKTSQEAVIATIQILEASPLFNAGVGAVYTFDGKHELDASIMHGKTLNAGAISGVKTIKSPITLAEKVMEESVHVFLSGNGAEEFGKQHGLEMVENSYFDTEFRLKALERAKQKLNTKAASKDYQAAHNKLPSEFKMGTVGAVALDQYGDLVAGTSTGGMTAKRYGRIGDSPIIGSGTYANNESCAVSATGHGEYFIRYQVAADICARVAYQDKTIEKAGEEVIFGPMFENGGTGGVIIIDNKGNISMPFNTSGMYRASRKKGEDAVIKIFK